MPSYLYVYVSTNLIYWTTDRNPNCFLDARRTKCDTWWRRNAWRLRPGKRIMSTIWGLSRNDWMKQAWYDELYVPYCLQKHRRLWSQSSAKDSSLARPILLTIYEGTDITVQVRSVSMFSLRRWLMTFYHFIEHKSRQPSWVDEPCSYITTGHLRECQYLRCIDVKECSSEYRWLGYVPEWPGSHSG